MSHDLGLPLARQTPPSPQGKPSLDRPSLFAADDPSASQLGDTQRVRILSTLESSRRPHLPPSRRARQTKPMGWLAKALIGLMAMGGLGLLAGFVMVIQQGSITRKVPAASTAAATTPLRVPAPAAGPAGPAAPTSTGAISALPVDPLRVLKGSSPDAIPGVAVIENVSAPAEPVASSPPIATPEPSAAPPAARKEPAKPTPPLRKASESTAKATAHASRPGKAAGGKDDDVALLEAMFAHAGPRKAPTSAADDLRKRCGALSGDAASACRAKVCAQHPKSQLCRD